MIRSDGSMGLFGPGQDVLASCQEAEPKIIQQRVVCYDLRVIVWSTHNSNIYT